MRVVLILLLVALGALAAYASGPGGIHGSGGLAIAEVARVSAGKDGRAPGVPVTAPPGGMRDERPDAVTDAVTDGNGLAEMPVIVPVAPRPLDLRVILSGHSLTDPMGQALPRLVRAAGGTGARIALSTIPGAPMDWRWNNRSHPPDARADIAGFDVMVQTERVSLSDTRRWHNSDDE